MGTPRRGLIVFLMLSAGIALYSCGQPQTVAIPTAPAAVAQAAAALTAALPEATSAPPQPTAVLQAAEIPTAAVAKQLPVEASAAQRALLDVRPGETLELLNEIPIARTDFGVRMAFSPASEALLHNGNGLLIQQFDLARGVPLQDLLGFEMFSPFTISVSADGSAVVADDVAQLRVWNVASGEQVNTLALPPVSGVVTTGFHGDEFFFAADLHGNVILWDPHSWGEISRFAIPGFIQAALLFPDGRAIALQNQEKGEIGIFDLQGLRLGGVPTENKDDLLLSISPGGDRFLLHVDYGYPTEGIRIVDVATGDPQLDLPMLNFRHFAVSSDWSVLAAVGIQNELRLYRLPEGQLLLAQPLEVARTLGISMSGDAAYLAFYVFKSGDAGAAIQVWGRASDVP